MATHFRKLALSKFSVAESRYEVIINRRGAEDAEEKERASFYLFMSKLCNAQNLI